MFKIRLLPTDKKFFVLFNQLSSVLKGIVNEFTEFLKNYETNNHLHVDKIRELEQKGNHIADELLKELFSNFVTPLDREDIHGLTKILNSIIDHVHGITRRFDMYNVEQISDYSIRLSEVLQSCVDELELLISRLNNMGALEKFTPSIEKLDKLEEKGDELYREAITELFRAEDIPPLEVVKWKDIYERLENAIDKCNDAGNIIMGMILKYA